MDVSIAIEKLRAICSKQEKAPSDIKNYLTRWGINVETHQVIIDRLKNENYIDERRYADAFIRDKIRFDHWGFFKIKVMLHQKGIDRKLTDELINAFDRNEYRSMIARELSKKRKGLKGTHYEIRFKLARYGSSRGYEMSDMEEFLDGSPE